MRAQRVKVALDALIAAVDVLDARNAREPVGLQSRDDERRPRAKVRALDARTVQVHIHNLRRKIEEDPSNPRYLRSVWGRGYILSLNPPAD